MLFRSGVIGITGLVIIVGSLVLIMLNNDYFNFDFVPLGDIVVAMFATLGGISGGALVLFFGGAKLTQTKAFRKMALTETQETSQGYTSNVNDASLVGKSGEAFTVLRPSGKIMIENTIYDASTRGEYIEKGEDIEVISNEGSTLRVKKKSA